MLNRLAHYFELKHLHTNWRQEIIAGITTFVTMVYIVMVNPAILGQAGVDLSTAFMATCIVAALGSILCGLFSNYPIALAPSMALNAYFTFSVVKSGQLILGQALACVIIAGFIFFLLTLLRVRDWLLKAIPPPLSHAIGAGIGLFIGFIGLKQLGVVVPHPDTLVALGNITSLPIILGFVGFVFMIVLDTYKIPGAILLSIVTTTLLGNLLGLNHFSGSLLQLPTLTPVWNIIDFHGLMNSHGIMIIFTFLLVALFDSTGTLLSLLYQAGLAGNPRTLKRISRAFYAESMVTMLGGAIGTSTTGPYVENAAGIAAGGRTGVTAITVGILFIFMMLLAPLATAIPVFAYAPALLFVAYKMCSHLGQIDWSSPTEGFPAVLIILLIPLTFSIANGIACGFIVYVIVHVAAGKVRELHWSTWLLFAVFLMYLALVNHH
jgi:AGZA family xanthine/uracil permease-like MFS transporter